MMFEKLEQDKTAKRLTKTVVRMLLPYYNNIHSITGDNGTEFADRQSIAKTLKTQSFFTHPYYVCEKNWLKNIDKLIRQYIFGKTDFDLSDKQ